MLEIELLSIKKGLELCLEKGLLNVIVESDSLAAIHLIHKGASVLNWKCVNIVDRINVLKNLLNLKFFHIFREGNQVADHLATETLSLKISKVLQRNELDQKSKRLIFSDKSGVPYLRIPK